MRSHRLATALLVPLLASGGGATLAAAPTLAGDPDTLPAFELQLPEPAAPSRRPEHLGRAALETLGVIVGGTVWYWSDLDFNARDWDLRWDWPSWRRKLTLDAVRFDQNIFQTNAVSHPRAGLAQYQIARGNGLGMAASVASTLASSVFWEYVVEFKEMPSANDMIVNTTAGLAIGEPFYQLGEFFLRSRPTLFSRGMAGALSPAAAMNDWVDRRSRSPEAADWFGFNSELQHRFELGAAAGTRTFDRQEDGKTVDLGITSDLVMLRGVERPGELALWTAPGAFTGIEGQLTLEPRGIVGGTLRTHTSLAGHYAQSYRRTPVTGIVGHGWLVGVGSAFEYDEFARPGGSDYMAIMNVVGPMFDLVARRGALRFHWSGAGYGDFAMVKSLGYENRLPPMVGSVYRPSEMGSDLPSVLGARGYYYAMGLSAGTRLALDYWGWDASAEVRGDHFSAIKGLDRFREEMGEEPDLSDDRIVGRGSMGVRPWGRATRVGFQLDWRWRRGSADDLATEHLDTHLAAVLSLVF